MDRAAALQKIRQAREAKGRRRRRAKKNASRLHADTHRICERRSPEPICCKTGIAPGVVVRKFSSFLLRVSQENFRNKTALES